MEVELGHACELPSFDKLVEIHLERPLERTSRLHESAVSFVPDRHVLEILPFKFQVRMNVLELDPGRGCQAVAPALGALQVHSRSASSRSARSRRSSVGLPERRVESSAKLVGIELAALVLVPRGKPLSAQRAKFLLRQFAVPVLIALPQKSWRHEHRWTEAGRSARSGEPAWTAAATEKSSTGLYGLHGFPLFRRKLEVHGPQICAPEQIRRPRQIFARFGRASDDACDQDRVNKPQL